MTIESVNPATGETVETYEETSPDEVAAAIEAADEAFRGWRGRSFAERAERLAAAAEVLRERQDEYGRLMAVEMGKPVGDGRSEAEKCAWVCDYYAENAERFLADEPAATDAAKSYVAYRPLGVVLAVMPWNFPFWQVFRFAAPGLMAGNVALLKHASNVPGCALAIEDVFRRAGFPDGLFKTLLIGSDRVENEVLDHPKIRAATLTGSVAAGKAIGGEAGRRIKKTVLELGGSDAYLVLEDADLDHAVPACVASRLVNSGQSCIAAKRFIVPESIAGEFTERFVEEMRGKRMGDPLDEATEVGPQARRDLRDDLHEQVQKSIAKGARLLLGGEVPGGPGAFYPPTVLAGVGPGMPAYEEELFGPAAAIIEVAGEEAAIRVANDSRFGLGAAVFSRDVERAERIAADRLDAGCCFVNTFVKSDPRLPFGGVKESGYGRELGRHGIREFVNAKTVWVA
jgi:succinate-semialdehyde dehydrogenase/glutarate-semialdehyde dehydrogenase